MRLGRFRFIADQAVVAAARRTSDIRQRRILNDLKRLMAMRTPDVHDSRPTDGESTTIPRLYAVTLAVSRGR